MAFLILLLLLPVLWQTFGECENYAALQGHTGAIFDVSWNSSSE